VQQPEPLGGAGHREVEVSGVVGSDPLRIDDHYDVELESFDLSPQPDEWLELHLTAHA
jgi:hypothetical protein